MKTWLLLVSLAAAIPCQDPPKTAAASATPHVLIETVGPDGWRMRLGPTNFGGLLASDKGQQLWQPAVAPLLGFWQQLLGDDAAFAASRERLLAYGGRVRAGLWFDAARFGRQPVSHAAIVFEGDGRTDLAALAKDLRLLPGRLLPGKWDKAEIGGESLEVYTERNDSMTAPIVLENCVLVAITAGDMATALTAARAFAASATGKAPSPNVPALRVAINLAAIVNMSMQAEPEAERPVFHALGLDTLGTCEITVGTAGPHVQVEVAQRFTADERGLFSALLPAAQEMSVLQRCIPKETGAWAVGHFDFSALYRAIEAAFVAEAKQTVDEFRADVKQGAGVDLAADVFAHMTDEALFFTSPLGEVDRPGDVTWSFVVRLRDAAAFAKGLTTMLDKAGPMLQREATADVGEVKLHRYGNMFGYDLWFASGNGVAVMSGGRDAETQATTLLGAAKEIGNEAATPPASFAELRKYLPPGHNGLGFSDIGSLIALPTGWWLMVVDELLPVPLAADDVDPEQREAARKLLVEHRLDTVRTATGYTDRTWRWRLYW